MKQHGTVYDCKIRIRNVEFLIAFDIAVKDFGIILTLEEDISNNIDDTY